jgi:hypothetical protein
MPEWLIELLLGTVASLLAGLLMLGVAGLFSKTARWVLTGILGRLLDVDVDMVFANPRQAADDLKKEISKSSIVWLFTGRGSELQRETFEQLLAPSSRSTEVKILLPLTGIESSQIDWVARRERENSRFDVAFGNGLLRLQIESTVKFLEGFRATKGLEVRLYNLPLIGRILITDSFAYLTPYRSLEHSRNSRVLKFRRNGDMYQFLARIFNEAWETGRSPWRGTN